MVRKFIQHLILSSAVVVSMSAQNYLSDSLITEIKTHMFTLHTPTDTIHFLKLGTKLDNKPILLFCQGSAHTPLLIKAPGQYISCFYQFYDLEMSTNYNIVTISKPHLPPIASIEDIDVNDNYSYKIDGKYDPVLQAQNRLDVYVQRASDVIACIKQQEWGKNQKIYVFGHSAGAYVAAKLAESNPSVSVVGYASVNPDGRLIGNMTEQYMYYDAKISEEQKMQLIEDSYKVWEEIYRNEYSHPIERLNGDTPGSLRDFSISYIETLTKLHQPLFVAYGTKDFNCALRCSQLPFYFIQEGKKNYQMFPVVGCGHNFEPISVGGTADLSKSKWPEVMKEFLKFAEKQ